MAQNIELKGLYMYYNSIPPPPPPDVTKQKHTHTKDMMHDDKKMSGFTT